MKWSQKWQHILPHKKSRTSLLTASYDGSRGSFDSSFTVEELWVNTLTTTMMMMSSLFCWASQYSAVVSRRCLYKWWWMMMVMIGSGISRSDGDNDDVDGLWWWWWLWHMYFSTSTTRRGRYPPHPPNPQAPPQILPHLLLLRSLSLLPPLPLSAWPPQRPVHPSSSSRRPW